MKNPKQEKENPDELVNPRDKSYVMFCLTTYYTGEWLDI